MLGSGIRQAAVAGRADQVGAGPPALAMAGLGHQELPVADTRPPALAPELVPVPNLAASNPGVTARRSAVPGAPTAQQATVAHRVAAAVRGNADHHPSPRMVRWPAAVSVALVVAPVAPEPVVAKAPGPGAAQEVAVPAAESAPAVVREAEAVPDRAVARASVVALGEVVVPALAGAAKAPELVAAVPVGVRSVHPNPEPGTSPGGSEI